MEGRKDSYNGIITKGSITPKKQPKQPRGPYFSLLFSLLNWGFWMLTWCHRVLMADTFIEWITEGFTNEVYMTRILASGCWIIFI